MQNPDNRTKLAAARRDFLDPHNLELPDRQNSGNDYADFMRDHGREVLADAVKHIDPVAMGMDRDQALRLAGAMKKFGFSRADFEEVMNKDPRNKGTMGKWWDKFTGSGRNGTVTEGTIFDYAKRSGWKWPAPGKDWQQQNPGRKQSQQADQDRQQPPAARMTISSRDITIRCLLDPHQYKEKPSNVWEIRNREPVPTPEPAEITLPDFARAVTAGQTFYPTVYSKEPYKDKDGKTKYNYRGISQQIFVVDIDNEEKATDENGRTLLDENGKEKKRRIKDYLTIDKALEICKQNDLQPFLVYETFSSKYHRDDLLEPYQKFRICFATDKPLTVQEYGEKGLAAARNYFVKLFGPAADSKTTDNARLIYGTDEKASAKLRGNFIDSEKFSKIMYAEPEPAEPDPEVDPEEEAALALAEYMQRTGANRLQGFIDRIVGQAAVPYIPTGYKALDLKMDGGLYPGLYILGAVSSLGKTTFALQMADQIATDGHDVLVFSLEMAADELIAKSISRQTMILGLARNMAEKAKTQRGITVYNFYKNYDSTELKLIEDAEANYEKISGHAFIFDDFMGINVPQIREIVSQHSILTGRKPVVLVDYLQVLEPFSNEYIRASDKQNTDKNIKELKLISRDFDIPVFAISSFNRDNYNTPASLQAFKESGGIEYGADCIMAMQAKGVGTEDFDIDAAKMANPREIELKILKQRGSAATATLEFRYYAPYNYFVEVGSGTLPGSSPAGSSGSSYASTSRKPAGIIGTGKGGRVTRRDKDRQKIQEAFYAVVDPGGKATLQAMADYLGIAASTVKSKIKDLGLDLSIDGEKKTADAEVTDWILDDNTPFTDSEETDAETAADHE